jgi:hypothetical protein
MKTGSSECHTHGCPSFALTTGAGRDAARRARPRRCAFMTHVTTIESSPAEGVAPCEVGYGVHVCAIETVHDQDNADVCYTAGRYPERCVLSTRTESGRAPCAGSNPAYRTRSARHVEKWCAGNAEFICGSLTWPGCSSGCATSVRGLVLIPALTEAATPGGLRKSEQRK